MLKMVLRQLYKTQRASCKFQSQNDLVGKPRPRPLRSEMSQERRLHLVPKIHMAFSETPACVLWSFTRVGGYHSSQGTAGMAWTLAWPAEHPTVTPKKKKTREKVSRRARRRERRTLKEK